MFDDARAHAEVRTSLMNADVPPIDLIAIRRRMNARREVPRARLRGRVAAAVAATIVAGLFVTARSPALVQSLRDQYVAALHAAGIGPSIPKPVPASIRNPVPARVSLAQAKQRANFGIVSPAGLPHDIASSTIFASPLAVWSKQSNAWDTGGVQVTFAYARADGRTFDLIASRYSALALPASRYVYDADDVPAGGKPDRRNRREQFVWRNGDQTLRAVTSPALSAREIDDIRTAMHGTPLPRFDGTARKRAGERVERFVIPR